MDILIQSVLQQAQRLRLAMHVRYYDAQGAGAAGEEQPEAAPRVDLVSSPNAPSYVIIHRPYQYLEPVIRQLFRQATDVQVLVDRRWHTRRAAARSPLGGEERRSQRDRRRAAPMLDILINMST
ncbi:MAG: hypothetical protein ACE147_17410 [Candidatus Methylomirabilales bacterium]